MHSRIGSQENYKDLQKMIPFLFQYGQSAARIGFTNLLCFEHERSSRFAGSGVSYDDNALRNVDTSVPS
jgi:hypothetical protein